MVAEATNPDWYGEENPLVNFRKQGKMSEKDFYFLDYLGKLLLMKLQMMTLIVFVKILTSYVNKMPRKFIIEVSNIKDPKGLVDYMVKQANSQLDNPSKYIKEVVAEKEEWAQIEAFSQQSDLKDKDVKKLRKILASFVKRSNFYNEKYGSN